MSEEKQSFFENDVVVNNGQVGQSLSRSPLTLSDKASINGVRSALVDSLRNIFIKGGKDYVGLEYQLNPIVIDASVDPTKAISILLKNKIRAAPVFDNEKKKIEGTLDLREMVQYALESYKKKSSSLSHSNDNAMQWLTISPQDTTQTLAYFARMRPFYTVSCNASIFDVLKPFTTKGCHIVGITKDNSQELIGVISQGQLFKQIAKKWTFDADVSLAALAKASYITSPVKSISHNLKAYDAFKEMSRVKLSGLAVIDSDGKIIHNTSASDIKLWLIRNESLENTIERFLNNIRKLDIQERATVTTISMDKKLKLAVGRLEATDYHRIWIVDQNNAPIGVLALTDIFRLVTENHLLNTL